MEHQTPSFHDTRQAISLIGGYWKGWNIDRTDAYARILKGYDPDIIRQAIDQIALERKYTDAPPVSDINDRCRTLTLAQADQHIRETVGAGVGCPKCLEEYGDVRHPKWVAAPDQLLVACTEHNWAWRGTLPAEPDPGELPADVWHQLAIQGTFGLVIQAYARAGHGPATLTEGLTTRLAERPAA